MNRMEAVLEGVYSNPELRKSIVPLFIGDPGLGKTKVIEAFAKKKGVNLVEFITSQRNPFEISGMAMPDRDTKKMAYWDFDIMLDLKDGDILFFDEVLNGNPMTLNACLTILEQRKMISGKDLPDIMIIAAANPQGMPVLTPQIKERFVWYNVVFDPKMWRGFMEKKHLTLRAMNSKLCDLIVKEDLKQTNFYTPRSVDKAVSMIIRGVPTPYEDVILPILSELVRNRTGETVDMDGDGKVMAVNESLTWIDLIRAKYKQDEVTQK